MPLYLLWGVGSRGWDLEYGIQGTRHRIQAQHHDPGSWIRDTGYRIMDPRSQICGLRFWMLDPAFWILDGSRIQDPGSGLEKRRGHNKLLALGNRVYGRVGESAV